MTTITISISMKQDLFNVVEVKRGYVSRSKYISNILEKEVSNEQNK